jgi:hypothetical protein
LKPASRRACYDDARPLSRYDSDARWRVPAAIRSYSAAGAREVALALD